MTFLEVIERWQREAVGIRPPLVGNRVGAVGGMPGPAFFPEGREINGVMRPKMANARESIHGDRAQLRMCQL